MRVCVHIHINNIYMCLCVYICVYINVYIYIIFLSELLESKLNISWSFELNECF